MLAVLCLVEFVGPCRFSHWNPLTGEPVAKQCPDAWVQIAAVSAQQTTNTVALFPAFITDHLKKTYGIAAGAELWRADGGKRRMQVLTSNPATIEGGRSTFVCLNEALDVDTSIPTPNGTARMGDLRRGDTIYGSDGAPVTVTKALPVQIGRDCYRVSLKNGASVVASDGHLWETKVVSSAAKPRIRTTAQMAADGRRFSVPRAGVQISPETSLPVDPYVFGAWLGDGSTGACNISIGDEDSTAMVGEFARRGVELRELKRNPDRVARFTFSNKIGFGAQMGTPVALALRALPAFREKYVPEEYHLAGTEQRKELLRGLMDTDGCFSNQGTAIFVGNERLAQDVFRLASSLGLLPSVNFAPDSRSRHGGTWRVHFMPEGFNPFSLPRKADRVAVRERRAWVSIDITKVESVPVRCIEVDAVDHLFQAGHGVVTHNTHHWKSGNQGIEMYDTIEGNVTKMGGRWLAITNAYMPGQDSVAERMRENYQEIQDGRAYDIGLLYDSIEADPRAPMTPEAMRIVLPKVRGDAVWLPVEDTIQSALAKSRAISKSRRMYYNQVIASEDAVYSDVEWKACEDVDLELAPKDRIFLGFDGGKTNDATALVALRVRDMFAIPLGVWEKPTGPEGDGWQVDRIAVDSAVHSAFRKYEVIGFYADVAEWTSYIDDWHEAYGEGLLIKANQAGNAIAWDMRQGGAKPTYAHERLVETVLEARLKHNGDSDLRRHVLHARRRENSYGLSFGKESAGSDKKIDAYAALMLAHECLHDFRTKTKEKPTPSGSVWLM